MKALLRLDYLLRLLPPIALLAFGTPQSVQSRSIDCGIIIEESHFWFGFSDLFLPRDALPIRGTPFYWAKPRLVCEGAVVASLGSIQFDRLPGSTHNRLLASFNRGDFRELQTPKVNGIFVDDRSLNLDRGVSRPSLLGYSCLDASSYFPSDNNVSLGICADDRLPLFIRYHESANNRCTISYWAQFEDTFLQALSLPNSIACIDEFTPEFVSNLEHALHFIVFVAPIR
ncbi:MAG: hypothetical protein AAGF13_01730 [Pseudomonadota bacterium]